jgi:NhaP-type Na+/H+ or K+/H+ antiporter
MLRVVRPKATIANILRWEGIVIDPIGALLAWWCTASSSPAATVTA